MRSDKDDVFDLDSESDRSDSAKVPLPADTPVEVTWGREHVQPVQFQGMDVGPFAMTLRSREGETAADVYARAMPALDALAEENYKAKLPKFLARVRASATQARGSR